MKAHCDLATSPSRARQFQGEVKKVAVLLQEQQVDDLQHHDVYTAARYASTLKYAELE